MISLDALCPITNCTLVNSTGAAPQSMNLTLLSSSSYLIGMDTSLPVRN